MNQIDGISSSQLAIVILAATVTVSIVIIIAAVMVTTTIERLIEIEEGKVNGTNERGREIQK